MMIRTLSLAAAVCALAACSDSPLGPHRTFDPKAPPAKTDAPNAQEIFLRYVALGTSNSMGVQSAGIFAAGQRAAWPAQLAARVGATYTLPLEQDPGCGPPLLPPLAADAALVAAFGNGFVGVVMNTCAPLQAGVVLPTGNVAISGADVHDALTLTPELVAATSARKGEL